MAGYQPKWHPGRRGYRTGRHPCVLEYSPPGDVSDDTQWIQAGETTTNEKGYYRFDELSEGYYRVKFQILEPYTITLVNQATLLWILTADTSWRTGGMPEGRST